MADAFRVEKIRSARSNVPADALYGVQTLRAKQNFPISGFLPLEAFVTAQVWIKKAAALTHKETGRLDAKLADAIVAAADEVLAGKHREQFIVDPYQAGAGTSHNMNINEVLANRANEMLGGTRGTYTPVHPNDHVNMAQSTNDTIPTNIRLACLSQLTGFDAALMGHSDLQSALAAKGKEFDGIVKAGRTHLQDAMPIRLGQEFTAYAGSVDRNLKRIDQAADYLRDLGIGGSAVGTGVTVEPQYPALMNKHLRAITGLDLRIGADRVQLMQSMGDVAAFSGALRTYAVDLSKIASDLRLMAMGPRTGIDEIKLPAVQPGSSIMPGKINPVDSRDGQSGLLPGHRLRHDRRDRVGARPARAERDDARDRVQRAALDAHSHERDARVRGKVRARHRGESRHVRVLGRAVRRARHRARAAHRLREGRRNQQAIGEGRRADSRPREARRHSAAGRSRRRAGPEKNDRNRRPLGQTRTRERRGMSFLALRLSPSPFGSQQETTRLRA